ncbi:MAG TPA: hypothetical protein VGF23_01900 [Gaiellaceae bacterium]
MSATAPDDVATSRADGLSGRARAVLGRLPRHLLADERGKLLGSVAGALGSGLDVQALQLGQVRRAHAFGDAEQERDVLLVAGLHGLRSERLDLLRLRLDAEAPVGDVRTLLAEVVRRHRDGSGTVGAVLRAAAAYLGLAVDSIVDADARFWHLAACRDRLGPDDAPGDLLALEKNPDQERQRDPIPRSHGQLWEDDRGGFEGDDGVTITVTPVDYITQAMVVARDIGVGFFYEYTLNPDQELRFRSDGTVTLDDKPAPEAGAAVLVGAFFADANAPHRNDPVFAADVSRPGARFVERRTGMPLPQAPRMDVGTARFAFFVNNPPPPAGKELAKIGLAWQERLRFAVRLWIPKRFQKLDVKGQTTVAERLRLLLDRHRAAGIELTVEYSDRKRCKYPDLASVPAVETSTTA